MRHLSINSAAVVSSPLGYSYIRFSHPSQAEGDSVRRQTADAEDWCRKHRVHLDASTTLHDLGKSAFTGKHRENPDRNALAAFLKLVEQGRIVRGSYLLIENLDRLSREHIRPALSLLLNLIEAGVRVVQLKPVEQVFDENVEPMQLMMAIMELARGNSESRMKSDRVGAAWANKRAELRKSGKILTHRLPAWVEEKGGKLSLIPERAGVIKRIFALGIAGYGQPTIVKRLTEEGVPAWGVKGRWTRTYVAKVLGDRRALGEFQPRTRGDKPDGPPITNYYPAVVTEEEFLAASAGAAQRTKHRGRLGGELINVFAGLLKNARDGDTYYLATRTNHRKGGKLGATNRVLLNTLQTEGLSRCYSFPFDTFEAAILAALSEINPREVLGQESGPDEVMVLSAELARVGAKIAELEAELLNGDVAALAKVLRQQEEAKRNLSIRLAEARQKASHPLSESWGEAQTLMDTVNKAADPRDARLRLRSAMRRIIESVWLLVIPRGHDRLAAVQVWFAHENAHRDYLIYHQPAKGNARGSRPSHWWARSLARVTTAGALDLRKREHARRLEAALSALDLTALQTNE